MIQFLRQWWRCFYASPSPWSQTERAIFGYYNGEKQVYADPLQIERALQKHAPEWPSWIKTMQSGMAFSGKLDVHLANQTTSEVHRVIELLTNALRVVFQLRVFQSGQGLSDLEVLQLFADYREWFANLMEENRPLPVSPGTTDSFPAATHSTIENSLV